MHLWSMACRMKIGLYLVSMLMCIQIEKQQQISLLPTDYYLAIYCDRIYSKFTIT